MAFVDRVDPMVKSVNDKMFEDMDVDDIEIISKKTTNTVEEGGSEEGEVSEDGDTSTVFPPVPIRDKKPERRFQNRAGGFVTGIDVFGKEEQARLVERAKRFGLDSSSTHTLSEKELKKLYWSVGADEEDSDKKLRFDSLTMHGTEAMSTKDIFEYFSDYAPSSIEWLDDNSCNVIWLDNLSAVRALLGLSKPIKYPLKSKASTEKKSKKSSKGTPQKEPESDIIMLDDDSSDEQKKTYEEFAAEVAADPEAVDLDELDNVPPGRWRKGKTHPHSDSILLQFARRTNGSAVTEQDGRPTRLPQPVFGIVGLISNSRKERIKKGLLIRPKHFEDDMGDERDFVISSDDEDNRNPWGTLAKSWSHIDRARRPPEPYEGLFGPALPPLMLPALPTRTHQHPQPLSILSRVGFRAPSRGLQHTVARYSSPRRLKSRSRSLSLSPERLPSCVRRVNDDDDGRRRVGDKRRRPSDFSDDSSGSQSDSDGEDWTKRIKVPRMRMYADDEEKRSKHRRPKGEGSRSEDLFLGQVDLRSRLRSDQSGHSRRSPPRGSSHRARSPQRREDLQRRNDRESAGRRQPARNGGGAGTSASSVWQRLERPDISLATTVTIKQEPEDSDAEFESDSTSCHSRTSSSSESSVERVIVRSTARYARQSDEEDRSNAIRKSNPQTVRSPEKMDLRSKLNRNKSNTQTLSTFRSSNRSTTEKRARSPLRIEIDNDEYYRLHGGKE